MVRQNQKNDVLNFMKSNNNTITSMEAFLIGITRLSAVIFNLRADGYIIETVATKAKNKRGRTVRFGTYTLKEDLINEN